MKTVYFRTFEEEDFESIYKWLNDEELRSLSVGMARPISRQETLDWLHRRMAPQQYEYWWAICSISTGAIIGWTYISNIHYVNSSAVGGGIVIGDKDYQNGLAWLETCIFKLEFVFERLNLHRYSGSAIAEHKMSVPMAKVLYETEEGVEREAVYKNGRYYDLVHLAILRDEYFLHKSNGEYELSKVLKRIREFKRK